MFNYTQTLFFSLACLLAGSHLAWGQMNYWQQEAHYQMELDLDPDHHRMEGRQTLRYVNNAPDTLRKVFYHLYFNAFQPNSMMDTRSRNLPDPDGRVKDRIQKLDSTEIGYHRIHRWEMNGKKVVPKLHGTVLEGTLPEALLPGDTAVFSMDFSSQVPLQIRRSGRDNEEGIDYTMTQWYPKMAAYDRHGWHPDPYVAREYYAPFGSYDVKITTDAELRIGGTGQLIHPEHYWTRDKEVAPGVFRYKYLSGQEKRRTWHFRADNVHNFAWAADPDYIHTQAQGPDSLNLHFYYLKKYRKTWEQLPDYTRRFFGYMNAHFGQYLYPQFSVIQGGDGGMEYPMCTMLKGTGELDGLVGVMAHEGAHNWYYGMLASNENSHPWMDEGFTSYAEEEVLNSFRDTPRVNAHLGAYRNHQYVVDKGELVPLATGADFYSKNLRYGVNAYSRGELYLNQLRYILGDDLFQQGLLRYYQRWKLRHPEPNDFLRVMEEVSGLHLDWYQQFWVETTQLIDYGIRDLEERGDSTLLRLEKLEEMPMPLRLRVTTRDGKVHRYYIPTLMQMGAPEEEGQQVLEEWPWTHPLYRLILPFPIRDIDTMVLDPEARMADINRANNIYPREGNQQKEED